MPLAVLSYPAAALVILAWAAGSFLLAGIVEGISGWRLTFIASAAGPLLAVAAIPLLPAPEGPSVAGIRLDFRPIVIFQSRLQQSALI